MDVEYSTLGTIITEEYKSVMRDFLTKLERVILISAVFDAEDGLEVDKSDFTPNVEIVFRTFFPSVMRLRKQSKDKAKAGRSHGKNTDKNSDSISDSNGDEVNGADTEKNPTNQPSIQPSKEKKEMVFKIPRDIERMKREIDNSN